MNRERWTSFPASTAGERALLAAVGGAREQLGVSVVAFDGRERVLGAALSIEAAEPFDGKADVVVRLEFEGAGPGSGERLAEDTWELLDRFLSEAEARARRRAADVR